MPRPARAYWKGYLRLSLVTIGVELHNAVENKSDIPFRQIHKPSGKRIHYKKVVEGVGEIDTSDIVKGYEVDTDTYIPIDPEDVDSLKLESKKTIDLVQFVDATDIDARYFERPYFMTPADKLSAEGYVVIREALRKTGKVGLAQITIAGREWLVAVSPLGDGLLMEMLRYKQELRDPADYFSEVPDAKPEKEMVELAVQLVSKKAGPFQPASFKDHYHDALRELIKAKMKGRKIVAPSDPERPRGSNVVDLMEALRKSVDQGKGSASKGAPKGASSEGRTRAKPKTRKGA